MFGIEHYGSFLAAILVFQLVPGAGTIAILRATAQHGIRAGLAAVLGTLAGDLLYMLVAVTGLAAVLQAHDLILAVLQWFGAAYLCFLGWQLLVAPVTTPSGETAPTDVSSFRHFRRAFAVSLTNPKVALFFVSFFPLFLRPETPRGVLAVMMIHVTLLSLAYQVGLVLLGNSVAHRLRRWPAARRLATRLGGVALVACGLRLAASQR